MYRIILLYIPCLNRKSILSQSVKMVSKRGGGLRSANNDNFSVLFFFAYCRTKKNATHNSSFHVILICVSSSVNFINWKVVIVIYITLFSDAYNMYTVFTTPEEHDCIGVTSNTHKHGWPLQVDIILKQRATSVKENERRFPLFSLTPLLVFFFYSFGSTKWMTVYRYSLQYFWF